MGLKIRNGRPIDRGGASHGHGRRAWRREAVEFAALFVAAGVAHLFSTALGHRRSGALMLVVLGGVLCAIVSAHLWLTHRRDRHGHAPNHSAAGIAVPAARLWRVRARVRETPGQLAALAAATAAIGGNILSLSTQPDTGGTVDELHVQLPEPVTAEALVEALTAAGGRAVQARPATVRELVDPVTRALLLVSWAAADAHRLPAALAALLEARLLPDAGDRTDRAVRSDRDTLSLTAPTGERIRLHRPGLPFTATETARALALLGHARRPAPARPT
ncbi:hypothetical protein [Actinoallomurus rhizosphaericola]|uniref:hypothetical protein n=1 Tax=Actinoallomurus rhizosphaericola TaxID=2952536 RepID=UPI0020921998|nr:hypothetical protein [Actinoallomurus rhizosphaericola]MCO5999720.1 hypothetical protein [Actinoallomurus rhizosphaericola]